MTSKDKTGDQLVASIRKSKSSTVAQKTATRSTAGKPTTARPAHPAKRTPAPKAKPSRGDSGYSYGRRVWPD